MKKSDKSVHRIQWENFATNLNMYTQPFFPMDNFCNIHPSFRTIFQLSPQDLFITLCHDLLGHPTRSERVVHRRRVAPRVGADTPRTWSHRIDEPRWNYRRFFTCGFLLIILLRIAMIDPFLVEINPPRN